MDLKDLIERGALVQNPPTPKEVTWTPTDPATGEPREPVTCTVYVKAPANGWLDRAKMAAARAGADSVSYESAIISHAILFGDDGTQHFTYAQAEQLAPSLAAALMAAYNAVNSPPTRSDDPDTDRKEEFAKNTEPTPGSGMNSSNLASADEASRPPANH